jgi:hypothetical protein
MTALNAPTSLSSNRGTNRGDFDTHKTVYSCTEAFRTWNNTSRLGSSLSNGLDASHIQVGGGLITCSCFPPCRLSRFDFVVCGIPELRLPDLDLGGADSNTFVSLLSVGELVVVDTSRGSPGSVNWLVFR